MENSFFLDCAISAHFDDYVETVFGLEHLKNTEVMALLDYGVAENLVVNDDGSLNLPRKAKNVLIGLPYEFYLETLNLESPSTLGLKKIVNKIDVKILNSREDFFIENDNGSSVQNARCLESINNSKKLFNNNVEFCPLSEPLKEASIKIFQKYPLPLNILAISANVSLEESENNV